MLPGQPPVTDAQKRALLEAITRAAERLSWQYPWEGLEDDLTSLPGGRLPLFGYGSLINRDSAAATLSGAREDADPTALLPVVCFGVRRVFDRILNPSNPRWLPIPESGPHRGGLNAHVTRNLSDAANGILHAVTREDIEALRRRETGYDLIPAVCLPWTLNAGEAPIDVWVLHTPLEPRPGPGGVIVRSSPEMIPHARYYAACRTGVEEYAAVLGENFLTMWLNSTFLGNASTPVLQWEASAD